MDENNLPVIPIIAVITTYHWTAIIWLVTARTEPDLVTPFISDLMQGKRKLVGFQGKAGSKINLQTQTQKKKKKKKRKKAVCCLSREAFQCSLPLLMNSLIVCVQNYVLIDVSYPALDSKSMHFSALSCKPAKPVIPPDLCTVIHI